MGSVLVSTAAAACTAPTRVGVCLPAPWTSPGLNGKAGHLDYGDFILLPVPVFQMRGLDTGEQLALLLRTEEKKALDASLFSSFFVISLCNQ